MAIAFGASVGTNTLTGSGTTITLTGVTVPAGGRLVMGIGQFDPSTPNDTVVSGVVESSSAVTFVKDFDPVAGQNARGHIWSADCPAGLSAVTVTATYSISTDARTISGSYMTGAVGGASGYLTGTASSSQAFGGTTWTSPSITPAANALVFAFNFMDGVAATNTGTVTSPGTEIHDFGNATTTQGQLNGYKIVGAGATTLAGTYTPAPGEQCVVSIAYKEAAAVAAAQAVHPHRMPLGV